MSNIFMIFRSTAFRFAALNGKISSFDAGTMTPLPVNSIDGITGERSSCFLKGEEREAPFLFLSDVSTFSSNGPSGTDTGNMLTMFELMLTDISAAGESQIIPSGSCDASTGSENTISMLLLPPCGAIMSVTVKLPAAGIVIDAFPFCFTLACEPSHDSSSF